MATKGIKTKIAEKTEIHLKYTEKAWQGGLREDRGKDKKTEYL